MARGLISLSDQELGWTGRGGSPRTPRPPGGSLPWYPDSMSVQLVDANSTATTVTNSNSETTIASVDLPALTLLSTGAARLAATGTISKNTAGTITFRLKAADASSTDTVLATTAITVDNSASPHPWNMEAWFLGKQPGVNRGWGALDIGTAGAGGSLSPSTFSAVGFSTMGLDERDEWTISITAQWSAASASLSVTRQATILEALT